MAAPDAAHGSTADVAPRTRLPAVAIPPRASPPPSEPPSEPTRAEVVASAPGWRTRPPHRPREVVADSSAGAIGTAVTSDAAVDRGATAPQLRRFIKSRAYVPMHELRRRFGINGDDDDVIPLDIDRQRVYVGLPSREGGLLGELLRAGDIGYELSLDPIAPIVVGVYPMRPVPRS